MKTNINNMKNRVLYSFATVLAIGILSMACSRRDYVVKGRIAGAKAEGNTVYLYSGIGPFFEDEQIIDSARIVGGEFEMRGKQTHPDVYTLKFFGTDTPEQKMSQRYVFRPLIPLFIGGGTVSVAAEYDRIPLDILSSTLNYDYSPITVAGPSDIRLFLDYARGKYDVLASDAILKEDYSAIYTSKDMKARIDYVRRAEAILNDIKSYATDFIERNSDNAVGLWALKDNLSRFSQDEIDALSKGFSRRMKASPLGTEILAEADRVAKCAVGATFTDFTLLDTEGNEVRLADHVGKGRYVLLEFWASYCGPCRFDIPHLKEVYGLYHDDGFDIISISMDDGRNNWLKAVEESDMPWMQLSELKSFEGQIPKIYNFEYIPFGVLIGPDGKILQRNIRGPVLDKKIVDIFGNKFRQ